MHKILTLIFLLYSICTLSQNALSIDFNLCESKDSVSVYDNDYKIIYNDSIVTEFTTSKFHNKLPDGKYRLEYKTYFGWETTNSFLLFNEQSYYLKFCIDKLDNPPIDIYNVGIDSIKDGEKLEITHNYSGCFNSGGEKIIIERIKNSYFLNYNNVKRKLKSREIDFFKTYEIELINLNTNKPFTFSQHFLKT